MGRSGKDSVDQASNGPLSGLRVVEFAGIGPAPFAAMLLSDMGADVLRITSGAVAAPPNPVTDRGRASLTLDLKTEAGRAEAMRALAAADVLIEGFRPAVMERLGLGPDAVRAANPRLIYGRMTGWGQDGPLSHAAGHDLTYIALTGALAAMGAPGSPPPPPLNLLGDFGGGALYLVVGVCAALYERERSGQGQVIDAAIVDGTASLMAMFHGFAGGPIGVERGRRLLGGDAPNYRTYVCADGRHVALAALEPKFWAAFVTGVGLDPEDLGSPYDPGQWPRVTAQLEALFRSRPRDHWVALLEGGDACLAPVLEMHEAPAHAHMAARGVYRTGAGGRTEPAPAPRFSRTPGRVQDGDPTDAEAGAAKLARWLARG